MKTTLLKILSLAFTIAGLGVMQASAVQISGEVRFADTRADFTPGATTSSNATGIRFINPVQVGVVTGDFGGVPAIANFNDFTFGPKNTLGGLAAPDPLVTFGIFSFALESLTENFATGGGQRIIEGMGTLSGAGFEDTPAFFTLSTSGSDNDVAFSASITARPENNVPDGGATIAMLGLSMIGFISVRRLTAKA